MLTSGHERQGIDRNLLNEAQQKTQRRGRGWPTDRAGKKIIDQARLESIQFELTNTLAEFKATGHQRFVG